MLQGRDIVPFMDMVVQRSDGPCQLQNADDDDDDDDDEYPNMCHVLNCELNSFFSTCDGRYTMDCTVMLYA